VADEKYFYHSFVSPCFAPEVPYLDYRLGRGSRKMPDYASISGHFARCFAYFAKVSGDFVVVWIFALKCVIVANQIRSLQVGSSC
jgi:hypothetical protein